MVKGHKQGQGEPASKKWPECCDSCTHNWQSEELTPKHGVIIINIFLLIIGVISILYALIVYLPTYFAFVLPPEVIVLLTTMGGPLGTITIVLGLFAFIAAIGMFNAQEYAWGMGLMVLAFIIANSFTQVWALLTTGAPWTSITFWLQLISVVIAVIGIPWLLARKARFR